MTGATGFVGGSVARRLQQRGFQVLATGRDRAKGEALGLPFRAADLDDLSQALSVCEGRDAVIHCAALSSPWGTPEAFHRHNVVVTRNLLRAQVPRFVHMSSAGVYFQQDSRLDVSESSPLPCGGQHPYLLSKRRAEEEVQATKGWVILRPRAVYGPGDQAIFPRIVRLLRYGLLPIIGDGQNLASLTYVENLALACEAALGAPSEGLFNITDGDPVELWPLLSRVSESMGLPPFRWRLSEPKARVVARALESVYQRFWPQREPPLTPYTLSLLTCSQTLSIEKARRVLGYQPSKETWLAISETLETL